MDNIEKKRKKSLKVKESLKKTAKKILKRRKKCSNLKQFEAVKEVLDSSSDASTFDIQPTVSNLIDVSADATAIPLTAPKIEVFNQSTVFCLFKENNCCLNKFIYPEEDLVIFKVKASALSEDSFRKFIAYRVYENVALEEGKCASISLYVLYLMSVHHSPEFLLACFDFLKYQPFLLHPEDVLPIFKNFGADVDSFDFRQEELIKKFEKNEAEVESECENKKWPYFNVEMVGQILLHYITSDFISINANIKFLVKELVKITLDPKIRSGSLLAIYSSLLTTLCLRIEKQFNLKEVASWLYLKEAHLLNQLEVCRIVSKSIFPDLHEVLVLTTISFLLGSETIIYQSPIEIDCIKLVLKKLVSREFIPVEFYCVLQLVNGLLPGITATNEDALYIRTTLDSLAKKITKCNEKADLSRLNFELTKVKNLVSNNTTTQLLYAAGISSMSFSVQSAKRLKCSK